MFSGCILKQCFSVFKFEKARKKVNEFAEYVLCVLVKWKQDNR